MIDEKYLDQWIVELKNNPLDKFNECGNQLLRLARLGLWTNKYAKELLRDAHDVLLSRALAGGLTDSTIIRIREAFSALPKEEK